MAKIRKTASIESGIMEVLKILSDKEIEDAIGKSSSYLRKCSNPDLPQQIDHNDSLKLDIACIKKGMFALVAWVKYFFFATSPTSNNAKVSLSLATNKSLK